MKRMKSLQLKSSFWKDNVCLRTSMIQSAAISEDITECQCLLSNDLRVSIVTWTQQQNVFVCIQHRTFTLIEISEGTNDSMLRFKSRPISAQCSHFETGTPPSKTFDFLNESGFNKWWNESSLKPTGTIRIVNICPTSWYSTAFTGWLQDISFQSDVHTNGSLNDLYPWNNFPEFSLGNSIRCSGNRFRFVAHFIWWMIWSLECLIAYLVNVWMLFYLG